MTGMAIILIFSFVLFAVWFFICVDITYRQRNTIINDVYAKRMQACYVRTDPEVHKYPDETMSYNRHFWLTFFFINARKYYL
jgi:hypothetical protein